MRIAVTAAAGGDADDVAVVEQVLDVEPRLKAAELAGQVPQVVAGREVGDDALVTASAEMKWLSGWAVAATFEGEFSDVTRSYAGKGVVRYAW